MAYLGRNLANLSDRVVLDSLTASATASYTLQLNSVNFVPSSASSLTVSLNGVIQKPESSYTVSGSTLTFASALTSSDSIDFIIAERGITLQTPSAGSVGTSQLASTAVTTAKIADDAVTKDKVSNLMYPAFYAYLSSNQTGIGDDTNVKIQIDTELFDSDGCYDNSTNYRFTPTVAGKYMLFAQANVDSTAATNLRATDVRIYKNGSSIAISNINLTENMGRILAPSYSIIVDANGTSDYFEVYAQLNTNNSSTFSILGHSTEHRTWFGGYKLIGA